MIYASVRETLSDSGDVPVEDTPLHHATTSSKRFVTGFDPCSLACG
ncbi:MAG: hypothetical protein ACI9N0_002793 [Ilumatobacter sp.]|jgi:hypothetical protein